MLIIVALFREAVALLSESVVSVVVRFPQLLHVIEELFSPHASDLIEETLTDSVSAAAVEFPLILVFRHVHPVDAAVIQTHNDAILVVFTMIVAVGSDVIGQFISSPGIKISHLVIWKVLAGQESVIIIINPVVELVKAVSSRDRFELVLFLSKPVQEFESMSRRRLVKLRVTELGKLVQGSDPHHGSSLRKTKQRIGLKCRKQTEISSLTFRWIISQSYSCLKLISVSSLNAHGYIYKHPNGL